MVRLLQQLKSLTAQGAIRLVRQLDARARWDSQATWYRLRYDDAEQARSALDLLSRHGGRVGLRWRTERDVSRLYVGVASAGLNRLAAEMARDLGFTLTAVPQLAAVADGYLHDGVDALPFPLPGAFCYASSNGETAGQGEVGHIAGEGDGYIINGHLFALPARRVNGATLTASYAFPTAAAIKGYLPGLWRLPLPVLGLALCPQWRPPLPLELPAATAEAWLLGRSANRQPLYGQRVSVLGEMNAVQQWLVQLVVAQAARNPVGVAVIDGEGDLVPRLLAEPVVARLLQAKQATSLDVNVVGQGGVNPLEPLPGETTGQTTARWRDWFARMGSAESGLALLPDAYAAGTTSLPQLRHWLEQLARNEKTTRPAFVAAAALRAVLDRLLADGTTARWLCQQPVDLGTLLGQGMLLVACPYQGKWSRAQALRALLPLLAFHEAAVILRLGARAAIPLSREELNNPRFIRIVSDSSNLTDTVIVTRSQGRRLASLTNHLLPQLCPEAIAPQIFQEYAGQLGVGEALALRQGTLTWVGWR